MHETELESIQLHSQSSDEWAAHCISNFDRFLQDHAACERKASATGITLVVRYPDRTHILQPLIKFSQEELLHFAEVVKLLQMRSLTLLPDEKNPYVNALLALIRKGRDEEFLDRLLCVGIIEARGCERFRKIANSSPDESIRQFYTKLANAEDRHHELFIKLAKKYFSDATIRLRLDQLLNCEKDILDGLPLRAAVH